MRSSQQLLLRAPGLQAAAGYSECLQEGLSGLRRGVRSLFGLPCSCGM